MVEFIKQMSTSHTEEFTSKIPIYHSDGTQLAVAKGNQLYLTEAGENAGVKMRHFPDATVCELNGKPAFELRRKGAAALNMTAELFTCDGAFLKWSEESLTGAVSLEPGALKIAGLTMSGNVIQAEVGIQIGTPTTSFGAGIFIATEW